MIQAENVHFTELNFHNSKVLSLFSPNGHLVASAVQNQLHIWDVNKKEISHKFECDGPIGFIKWSPDSELISCGRLKDFIHVWNLEVPHWRYKVSGCLAFVNVYWAPDSHHLLVISEFYVKATVCSLVSSEVTDIDNLKAIENGIVISPCEKYVAVAQRLNLEDYLAVYSSETWEVIKVFPIETKDLVFISFSPNDLVIAILENALIELKVLFYSIDGRLLGKFMSEANLGLITLSWSPVKNFVSFGDCSGEVKVLDCLDFEIISTYHHPDVIESPNVILYKTSEHHSEMGSFSGNAMSSFFEHVEVVKNRPISIVPSTPDIEKGKIKNPLKHGVQTLLFSSDGKYISSINGHMPKTVFIYDTEKKKLRDVIIRGSNIKSICWHPVKPYLIICSTSNLFDVWTPEECIRYISSFSKDFLVSDAVWSPKGDKILLNSREHFSVVYFS